MPTMVYMVLLAIVLIVIAMVALSLWQRAKTKKRIVAEFGKEPTRRLGLRDAARFWQEYATHTGGEFIDDVTWNDLDMDNVFGRINNCQSTAGDVALYTALRRPLQQQQKLQKQEELVCFARQNPALRLQMQLRLAGLGRGGSTGIGFVAFYASKLALAKRRLYQVMAILPLLLLVLLLFWPQAGLLIIAALLANIILFFRVRTKYEGNFFAVRYLSSCIMAAKKLAGIVQGQNPALAKRLRAAAAPFAGFTRSYTILTINDIITQSGLFDPGILFLLPALSYAKMAAGLAKSQKEVVELYSVLGQVDMAISLVSYRESCPLYTLPQFTAQSRIYAEQLVHPLLEDAVDNSAGFEQNVLLTGSNASGKSTFIKAVAINCILAQTINTCTATRFKLRPGFVASSMAVQDNIIDGDSYFIAEIKSMQRLMRLLQSQPFSYFFIDEILKGTNTVERVGASAAVLLYLCSPGCLCFAATHDIELTEILKTCYDNYHFTETVTGRGDVEFNYHLQKGPATSRNAILLLESTKFPAAVTSRAKDMVQEFEQMGEWQRLEKTP